MPPAFQWWLNAINESTVQSTAIQHVSVPSEYKKSVNPLITTRWNQYAPYNNHCPYPAASNGNGDRCLTGCVATAMAQIMNYHKYPNHGVGSISYDYSYNGNSGSLNFNFEDVTFDWSNMLDNYDSNYSPQQADAVSWLMAACGASVKMGYSKTASAGSFYRVDDAFLDYFDYERARFDSRSFYDDEHWMMMIFSNLSNGLPILYTGDRENKPGHAFILDGYDENGLVHVNWGWGGLSDGYYSIDGLLEYNYYQAMVFDILPRIPEDYPKIEYDLTLNQPGTLSEKLKETYPYKDVLKIHGTMNGADLKELKQYYHHIECLDLSDVRIVASDDVYFVQWGDYKVTEDDIMPAYAFAGVQGLKKVILPNSCKKIVAKAFYDCYELRKLVIPAGVTVIQDDAFDNSSDNLLISVSPDNSYYDSREGINGIVETATNRLMALWVNSETTKIPNSIEIIGKYSLYGNLKLCQTLLLPEKLVTIDNYAFYGCSGLNSIIIPNSVMSIGTGVFSGCSSLTSIIVENGNSKYDSRNNCNAVIETSSNELICGCKNTVIPNSVTSIGSSAFSHCSGLTSITIPNSVTWIGWDAFFDCSDLTSITIGNNVTSIGSGALWGCSNLTSITIPNSVTSIGWAAFYGCTGLTYITIPNSVTSIGESAFSGCSGLTAVISNIENVFSINENTFDSNTYSKAKLYVPVGKKSVYQETDAWKNFITIEEYDDITGIAAPKMGKDVKVVDAYQLNGQKLNGVQRGLNIVRMSDGTTRKVVVK